MTTYHHEPPDYLCPFCCIIQKAAHSNSNFAKTDVIYYSETVTAFLALGRWLRNPVDVLVVPSQHFENLYDLPAHYAQPLHTATRAIALALNLSL